MKKYIAMVITASILGSASAYAADAATTTTTQSDTVMQQVDSKANGTTTTVKHTHKVKKHCHHDCKAHCKSHHIHMTPEKNS